MMKYKIIPDDIVKNMIEFLDEIQFEAAAGNKPDDLHRINFCNYIISELIVLNCSRFRTSTRMFIGAIGNTLIPRCFYT